MLDYKSIGRRIRNYRKRRGYTQEQLGLSINTSGAYISNIERGVKKPSLDNLAAIAEILDITINDVIVPEHEDLDKIIERTDLLSHCPPEDRTRLKENLFEIITIFKHDN